jgi:hypothetical protein
MRRNVSPRFERQRARSAVRRRKASVVQWTVTAWLGMQWYAAHARLVRALDVALRLRARFHANGSLRARSHELMGHAYRKADREVRIDLLGELVIRFALGGVIVSAFAVLGEVFNPKTFSGLFGAAPSVALGSLALAFAKEGVDVVRLLGRSMVIGAFALFAYGCACVASTKREGWPVWLSAAAAWLIWFAVAFVTLGISWTSGVLR